MEKKAFTDKIQTPDSVSKHEIGKTTYIVSTYGEEITRSKAKEKLIKLIEAKVAEELSEGKSGL